VDDDAAFECMKAAYDAGCNFFDNAEVYASGKAEETMGRCIKRLGVPRSELVISTKIFWGGKKSNQTGLSRKHIIEGCNAALKRLDLEYVDLIFCHRPDIYTPIEETVRAMNFLLDQGKAFYWGTSEWPADEIMQAHAVATRLNLVGPLMEQPQYSMLHRTKVEREYSRLYKEIGLGTTIWSPLAGGLLTGKYVSKDIPEGSRYSFEKANWLKEQLLSGKGVNGLEEKNFDSILAKTAALKPIADKLGCTMSQLALAWCVKNPNVSTVITGATKVSQVVENFASLKFVSKLTPDIMTEIEGVLKNKPDVHTKDFR